MIKHSAFRTVERGGQFVLLGSAPDPKVQVRKGLGRGWDRESREHLSQDGVKGRPVCAAGQCTCPQGPGEIRWLGWEMTSA